MPDNLKEYLKSIEKLYQTAQATEHSYRAALQTLLQNQQPGLTVINEPKRVECGAPDLTILRDDFTIGYLEAKDIGRSLDEADKTEQLKRYKSSLDNLILTDYLEFRWYLKGELHYTAKLGAATGQKIKRAADLTDAENLLTQFLAQSLVKLTSSQEVAQRMAKLTHLIRTIVIQTIEQNHASNLLKDLRRALAQTLLPGLDEPGRVAEFADIYAQTIAYGLFAARCNHQGHTPFTRATAAAEIPKTNPFLRRLFTEISGPDLADEPYIGFVKDLVQLLANADMEAILTDFGRRTRQEDPIVHFYETFLATYDPRLRELRGVYYTPAPVVSYLVRSVDHLLKTRFNLPDGLADITTFTHNHQQLPKMLLLDPAAGTGTFLYGVIDHIRNRFRQQGNVGMWSSYVKDHLLNKLYGFELLMVPYAVAHFKLAMQLAGQDLDEAERANWAYDFGSEERLKIFLTNTLEEIEQETQTLFGLLRIITEEAKAAAAVKRDLPILVVMGNPPYSGHSANRSWTVDATGKRTPTFIGELIQDYYRVDGQPLGERNPKWLQDDYVKFIRWGQWRIEQTGAGILAFITNHGYLDNPTFRGMRQNLMHTFTDIYLLNLHGNAKKKETAPDGGKDENVFDIQQGVAIGLFIKEPGKTGPANVYHADLWGERATKYESLAGQDIASTEWIEFEPKKPFYLFAPQNVNLFGEYQQGWGITEIFVNNNMGITTGRDAFVTDYSSEELKNRLSTLKGPATDQEIRETYNLHDSSSFSLKEARLWSKNVDAKDCIIPFGYRCFDQRYIIYSSALLARSREDISQHFIKKENLALITFRAIRELPWLHIFVSDQIVAKEFISSLDNCFIFPLYLYPPPRHQEKQTKGGKVVLMSLFESEAGYTARRPNLNPKFVQDVEQRLGLAFTPEGQGDLQTNFGPEDIFDYIYAVFHSPTYRSRYAEFLKIDFPRVPLTQNRELFAALVKLGQELVKLHLLEQVPPWPVSYPVKGDDTIARAYPKYNEAAQRVYLNKTQYFEGIAPDVWDFHIGGYQVLEKWLKDRQGRKLSYQDLSHYQKVVAALKQTIALMVEIDNTIPAWPIQ
ncbi:MAG: N-6 DNA methylase [Anaerolineae bacterium]|nr:N-6 DNA methylase [Anaerolineae bacterium]